MSPLLSPTCTLSSTVRKNGHSAWRRRRSKRCAVVASSCTHCSSAVPTPYQPGRLTRTASRRRPRDGAQVGDAGRRLAPSRGASRMLSCRCGRWASPRENSAESSASPPTYGTCQTRSRSALHCREPTFALRMTRASPARQQHGVDQLLQVPVGDVGVGITAADHLALFCHLNAPRTDSGGCARMARLVGPPPRPSVPRWKSISLTPASSHTLAKSLCAQKSIQFAIR